MDDFVILTYSRWQLRKQVKQLNKYLASLGFEKHPDKTFIGKVSRGLTGWARGSRIRLWSALPLAH